MFVEDLTEVPFLYSPTIFFFWLCVHVWYVYMVQVLVEARMECQLDWNWSHRVLASKLRSSGKAGHTLLTTETFFSLFQFC